MLNCHYCILIGIDVSKTNLTQITDLILNIHCVLVLRDFILFFIFFYIDSKML